MNEYPYPDLSKIRDRKDKWGMQILLPEHRDLINQMRRDEGKVPKPEMDRFDWEMLEEELAIAIREKSYVTIRQWRDGHIIEESGVIEEISMRDRTLYLLQNQETLKIQLQYLVGLVNLY